MWLGGNFANLANRRQTREGGGGKVQKVKRARAISCVLTRFGLLCVCVYIRVLECTTRPFAPHESFVFNPPFPLLLLQLKASVQFG